MQECINYQVWLKTQINALFQNARNVKRCQRNIGVKRNRKRLSANAFNIIEPDMSCNKDKMRF